MALRELSFTLIPAHLGSCLTRSLERTRGRQRGRHVLAAKAAGGDLDPRPDDDAAGSRRRACSALQCHRQPEQLTDRLMNNPGCLHIPEGDGSAQSTGERSDDGRPR